MTAETQFLPAIGGTNCGCADSVLAHLAGCQHGVIARWQLLDAGMSRHAIQHQLDRSRLHQLYVGVYAAGHCSLTREGRWMAAVLACGRNAVLSHRSAATNLGIRIHRQLEVTSPRRRARPGITVYTSLLPEDEIRSVNGIPTTCVARTLLDLAAVLQPYQLERAFSDAETQRFTDPLSLADMIARYPGRKGIGNAKAILAADVHMMRSDLEALFIDFVRRNDLPPPRTNYNVLGYECDCVWPEQRLVAELDTRATHDTRAAFEQDRERDRTLQAAGWCVVRLTPLPLTHHPDVLAANLRSMLAPRGVAALG